MPPFCFLPKGAPVCPAAPCSLLSRSEEVRHADVRQEAVGHGLAMEIVKEAVTVGVRSDRVEHRALGEVVVAANGPDVALAVFVKWSFRKCSTVLSH